MRTRLQVALAEDGQVSVQRLGGLRIPRQCQTQGSDFAGAQVVVAGGATQPVVRRLLRLQAQLLKQALLSKRLANCQFIREVLLVGCGQKFPEVAGLFAGCVARFTHEVK